MKKLALFSIFVAFALIPTLLLAQPPRPRHDQMPHGRPPMAHPSARPTMQVHVPPRAEPVRSYQRYDHYRPASPPAYYGHHGHYGPAYYPPVARPNVVVVPQVVAAPVIAPCYHDYYAPVGTGFSLTLGGRNGAISVYSGR